LANRHDTRNCVKRALLSILIVAVTPVFGQQKTGKLTSKPVPPKPGIVSGRVFAITGSGDIKPGRMTTLVLLYCHRHLIETKQEDEEGSVYKAFLTEQIKASQENRKVLEEIGKALKERLELPYEEAKKLDPVDSIWNKRAVCLKELGGYYQALSAATKWEQDNPKKSNQMIPVEADEEGNFKVSAPPGVYILIARGRAGFNQAVWLQRDVVVEPGKETTIKLSSPEKACLVTE
jgi:hypothetical protein